MHCRNFGFLEKVPCIKMQVKKNVINNGREQRNEANVKNTSEPVEVMIQFEFVFLLVLTFFLNRSLKLLQSLRSEIWVLVFWLVTSGQGAFAWVLGLVVLRAQTSCDEHNTHFCCVGSPVEATFRLNLFDSKNFKKTNPNPQKPQTN